MRIPTNRIVPAAGAREKYQTTGLSLGYLLVSYEINEAGVLAIVKRRVILGERETDFGPSAAMAYHGREGGELSRLKTDTRGTRS